MSAEVSASPTALVKTPLDKVRALQHTLYRTAKADPGRRFHALWDKVCRRDVLCVDGLRCAPATAHLTLTAPPWTRSNTSTEHSASWTSWPLNCERAGIARCPRGEC